MGFGKYESIVNLQARRYNSAIRVRIQSLWRGVSRDSQEFRGINMILLDYSGERIHAFVSTKYAAIFENDLREGEIIGLKNFAVKQYVGDENNRTVRNEKHIYLSNQTILTRGPNDVLKIPDYCFDLYDFDDLRKIYMDNCFLVGVIEFVGGKTVIKKDNEDRSHVKFDITNGSTTIPVTFFGPLGDEFQEKRKSIAEETVIIIISSAKVNEWNDKINLTNYPATRFYLNANHYSVKSLMTRAEDPSFHKDPDIELGEEEIRFVSSVKDIKDFKLQYEGKVATCEVVLKRIEETQSWFYNKCTNCPKELISVDGSFFCDDCKRIIPYPSRRFRILAVCLDMTGVIQIIIPDHEVRKLIGKCVFEVRLEDDIGFPKILTNLENKKFSITVLITKENITNCSDVYSAIDVSSILDADCSPEKSAAEEEVEDTSMMSVKTNEEVISHEKTPSTHNSTNKGKGRKIVDEENTPLGVFKNRKNSGRPSLT